MIIDLLKKRFTAKWWNKRSVSENDLNIILESAFSAPSKQSKYNYTIFVFTDSDQGRIFKEWFYWENTACLDKVRGKQGDGLRRYNGQVLAPLYLLWVAKNDTNETRDDCVVSATVAMIAAEELGLQTGLCGCIGPEEIREKLNAVGTAIISLGIGYADSDSKELRKVFKDDKEVGFDLSNCDPIFTKVHVRKTKPEFQNLIKII